MSAFSGDNRGESASVASGLLRVKVAHGTTTQGASGESGDGTRQRAHAVKEEGAERLTERRDARRLRDHAEGRRLGVRRLGQLQTKKRHDVEIPVRRDVDAAGPANAAVIDTHDGEHDKA